MPCEGHRGDSDDPEERGPWIKDEGMDSQAPDPAEHKLCSDTGLGESAVRSTMRRIRTCTETCLLPLSGHRRFCLFCFPHYSKGWMFRLLIENKECYLFFFLPILIIFYSGQPACVLENMNKPNLPG